MAGEALWPANSTTATCGSGEVSGKLASPGVLVVFDWRGGSMKSSAARLLDKVGAAGLLTGHAGASPWPARFSATASSSRGGRTAVEKGESEVRGRAPDVSASRWRQGRGWGAATASPRACQARSSLPGSLRKTTGARRWAGPTGPRPGRQVSLSLFILSV